MNKIKETFRIPTSLNPLEWTHSGMSNIQTPYTFWNSIIAMKVFWVPKGWNELILVSKIYSCSRKCYSLQLRFITIESSIKKITKIYSKSTLVFDSYQHGFKSRFIFFKIRQVLEDPTSTNHWPTSLIHLLSDFYRKHRIFCIDQ